jgi:peptidoglycan hydrolase-like protein with peptidoglycan-binding domain
MFLSITCSPALTLCVERLLDICHNDSVVLFHYFIIMIQRSLLGLLCGVALMSSPLLVFAQSPGASDSATLAQLMEQITALRAQVAALSADMTTTKNDIAFIKEELRITKTLKQGMRDAEVSNLQQYLAQYPELYPEGLVTGYYGARTEAAVKKFQQKNGVEAVGIVGPQTRAKLNTLTVSTKKITLCHRVSEGATVAITIAESALATHLAHGDTQGPCPVTTPIPTPTPTIPTTPRETTTTTSACEVSTSWVRYENVANGFAISHPSCWTPQAGGMAVVFRRPEGRMESNVVTYQKSEGYTREFLMSRVGVEFSDRRVTQQPVTIDGVAGLLVTVTTEQIRDYDWIDQVVYLERDGRIYVIRNGAPADPEAKSVFERFYSSFQFLGVTTVPNPTPTPIPTPATAITLVTPSNTTIPLGSNIDLTWKVTGAPANSQVVMVIRGIDLATQTSGVSGGKWQNPGLTPGTSTGVRRVQTGPAYLEIPGVYEIVAYVGMCSPSGCLSNFSSDYLATSEPVRVTLMKQAVPDPTVESVILHSFTLDPDRIVVKYEKNFVTCVHLVTPTFQMLSTNNHFCGDYRMGSVGYHEQVITSPSEMADLRVTLGQSVKLCHGNNYNVCSQPVTITTAANPG